MNLIRKEIEGIEKYWNKNRIHGGFIEYFSTIFKNGEYIHIFQHFCGDDDCYLIISKSSSYDDLFENTYKTINDIVYYYNYTTKKIKDEKPLVNYKKYSIVRDKYFKNKLVVN